MSIVVTLKRSKNCGNPGLDVTPLSTRCLILQTDIAGDLEALRVERVARAFDGKCPKLMAWAKDGRTSVLILESDDIQLSNIWVTMAAVKAVLAKRGDQPDVIVLKRLNGVGYYTHGDVSSLPNVRSAR